MLLPITSTSHRFRAHHAGGLTRRAEGLDHGHMVNLRAIPPRYNRRRLSWRVRACRHLAIAAIASFVAGCVGTLLIALFGPPLAEAALKFGAPEYFALMLMALIAAACLAHGDMVKSLAMVFMGLLFGIIGTDVNSGMARFSFGLPELTDGIGFTIVAVGLFAVSEIVKKLESGGEKARVSQGTKQSSDQGGNEGLLLAVMRGTGIGAFCGALPAPDSIARFRIHGGEKDGKDPSRSQRRHRGRCGAGGGQTREAQTVHPHADPGHKGSATGRSCWARPNSGNRARAQVMTEPTYSGV